jgi:hypothetical protein
VDYYNATEIAKDSRRYDACVKMLWPVHMATLVLQLAVLVVFALAAIALLVNLFTTVMVVSLGLDRLVRTVSRSSGKELDSKDSEEADATADAA